MKRFCKSNQPAAGRKVSGYFLQRIITYIYFNKLMHFIRIKCYYLRQDHCKFLAKLIIVAIFFTKNRKEHIVPTYNILFCHHHTLFSYFQTFVIVVASFWCCCCCTLLLLLLHPSVSIVSPPDLKGIALTIDRLL